MMAMVRAFAAGKFDEALTWHRKLFPLCRDLLSVATNPIPVKTAMKLLGRGTGELRLPMTPLDAAGEAKIRQTLAHYGLM
jgi:4-hydroxy-tetrahydrodipicolinate synthase